MIPGIHPIDSPETMSAAIRHVGIIPFVRNTIPGWSIEELTAKGAWFWDDGEGGVLGVGEVEGEFFVEGHPVEVAEGVDGGADILAVVIGGVEVEPLPDEGALGLEEEGGEVVGVVDEFDGLLLRGFVHGEEFVKVFVEGNVETFVVADFCNNLLRDHRLWFWWVGLVFTLQRYEKKGIYINNYL